MRRRHIGALTFLGALVALLAVLLWGRTPDPDVHGNSLAAQGPASAAGSATNQDQGRAPHVPNAPAAPPVRGAGDLNLPPAEHLRADAGAETREGGGLLLSLPLRGGVDPDTGAAPTKSSGLVVSGRDVEFGEDAELTVPAAGHVDGDAGSISLEIQANWSGAEETANSLLQIRDQQGEANALLIVKERNALRFIVRDDQGLESSINAYIDNWQANEPHRVTATWGEALMKLYLDGTLVGQNTVSNSLHWQDTTPIHIGSDFPGGAFAGASGKIRDLQIYGRVLAADEIRRPPR